MTWLSWPDLATGRAPTILSFVAQVIDADRPDRRDLVAGDAHQPCRGTPVRHDRAGDANRSGPAGADGFDHVRAGSTTTALALHDQTNQMLALGENAAMRIAAVGAGVGEQAATIEASAARLDTASASATGELTRLIDALPEAYGKAEVDDARVHQRRCRRRRTSRHARIRGSTR